ncbi:uncharacterized protein EAE98_003804 [Botrytis deweyae]|uniref:Uncharacterized protein n=1 Tax=Botrytis deweyae TaxID=2478750 RepID=A0ABQ7IRT1_9HELO|nr:uncharacterized protein EAE98_003804 [Botrytis deweyae]KAF7932505.1 hypothetical protein EAE98_003804 [Botrytis deweyae]
MTAANPEKRGHLVQEDENSQPRHQDEVLPKESFCATSMHESDTDSRSMAQEVSTNGQRIPSSHDTHKYKDVKHTVPDREIKQQAKRDELDTDQGTEESGYGKSIRNIWAGFSKGYLQVPDRQQIHSRRSSFGSLQSSLQQPQVHDKTGKYVPSVTEHEEIRGLEREIDRLLKDNDRHDVARGKIEGDLRAMQRQNDISENLVRKLQAKNQKLEFEKQEIEEKHNTFIRKQQEASFNQMTNSRWMPVEDSKVIGDLDRLKRDMRNWAKKVSVNDLHALLRSLGQSQSEALWEALGHVLVFEHGQLPRGLSPRNSPGLLLTALLSHDIYKTMFVSPFFFIGRNIVDGQLKLSEHRMELERTYRYGRHSNEEDAHTWRSEFLRLQLPPITPETSDAGKFLHYTTMDQIVRVADQQAFNFMEGPARWLISDEARNESADKLQAIYREAANISYMLWTRRTALEVFFLEDMRNMHFRFDNKYTVPHSSVKYEDHEDQLEGRALSIIVHPCLVVSGTDDAKNYDQRRVWAPAEVWLDSSVSSND